MPPVKKHTRKWRPTKRLWGLLMILLIVPLLTMAVFAWRSDSTAALSQLVTTDQAVKPLENRKINILILGID